MLSFPAPALRRGLTSGACFVVGLVLIGQSAVHSADPPAQPSAAASEPKAEAKKADPFVVPEGTAEQLVEYLNGLRHVRPENVDSESVERFRTALAKALLTATERLLLMPGLTKEQAVVAVQAKLAGLSISDRNDPLVGEKLEAFREQLEKSNWPMFAREVRRAILQRNLRAGMQNGEAALMKAIDEIKLFIGSQPKADDVGLVMNIGMILERTGRSELAAATLANFAQLFGSSPDKDVVRWSAKFAGVARRLTLPGKPMELEGTLVDGKPLNWAGYQGKVVLVDFWATWCGPCLAELPNVKKAYQLYHQRGFDVLGISLDRERSALEAFLKREALPWSVAFSDKPDELGFDAPMAVRYGVLGIPCMLLVGKDGKVLSLSARGPKLLEELARLLGPVEDQPETEPDAKPQP